MRTGNDYTCGYKREEFIRINDIKRCIRARITDVRAVKEERNKCQNLPVCVGENRLELTCLTTPKDKVSTSIITCQWSTMDKQTEPHFTPGLTHIY